MDARMRFPSKYIGILDEVGAFRNGALPATTEGYTGHWQWNASGHTVLEGDYQCGIPCGMWYYYYCNKVPKISAEYDGCGNYTAVFCFPDGMPRQTVAGRYEFRHGRYVLDDLTHKFRNFDGDIVEFRRGNPSMIRGWQPIFSQIPLELHCTCRGTGEFCSAFLLSDSEHSRLALYWLGGLDGPLGGFAVRTDFLVKVDRTSGELASCHQRNGGGGEEHFSLRGACRCNDRLRMNFQLPCAAADELVEVDFPLDHLR